MNTENFFRKDYSEFRAFDFLRDECFIAWVKYGGENQNLDLYWKIVIQNNPGLSGEIQKAIQLVKAIVSEDEAGLNSGKEATWTKIQSRISKTSYIPKLNRATGYLIRYKGVAAILIVILLVAGASLGGSYLEKRKFQSLAANYTTVYSPAGQKTELTLPDNSKVWLNSKSSLKYSADFNVNNRDIYLEGEAFFDVVKGETPFTVRTEAINIRVLGTSFNVKCYHDEDIVEATLVKGSMIVEKAGDISGEGGTILLAPNQKVVFSKIENIVKKAEDIPAENATPASGEEKLIASITVEKVDLIESYDTKKSTGWVDGLLYIESESLLDLSKKLERRYDVEFVFMSEDLKSFKYTGTLREFSLEQVLNAIQSTSPVKYRVDEQIVYIGMNAETISDYVKLTK